MVREAGDDGADAKARSVRPSAPALAHSAQGGITACGWNARPRTTVGPDLAPVSGNRPGPAAGTSAWRARSRRMPRSRAPRTRCGPLGQRVPERKPVHRNMYRYAVQSSMPYRRTRKPMLRSRRRARQSTVQVNVAEPGALTATRPYHLDGMWRNSDACRRRCASPARVHGQPAGEPAAALVEDEKAILSAERRIRPGNPAGNHRA